MTQTTKRTGRATRKATPAQKRNEAFILEQIRWCEAVTGRAYKGMWITVPLHNAIERLERAGVIKFSSKRDGWVRA